MLFFNFAWKPMPPFWDCLTIFMGTFTIFWLSWTDSFRIQQIDSFRFLGQIFTPVGNSAMEIPKWIGSSDIDCITHLQYDKLWGLPRRVFTLLKWSNQQQGSSWAVNLSPGSRFLRVQCHTSDELQQTGISNILHSHFKSFSTTHIWVIFPRTGKMSKICLIFFVFEASLWPNGLIFLSFLNCSEEIMSVGV